MRRGHPAVNLGVDALVEAKHERHLTVSACVPARNEEATIAAIVRVLASLRDDGLVDEIVVADDGSTDATAVEATAAGATVVQPGAIDGEVGTGKGEALWTTLASSRGDIVCWVDADIVDFEASFVRRLVAPLIVDSDVDFVKGYYHRPLDTEPGRGGRVTELVARPLLSLLHPDLAEVVQPLSGEYAGRRSVLEQVPFVQGWGVDLALILDVAGLVGLDRMVQVDLGIRRHRHHTLDALGPQAAEVMLAALDRAGVAVPDEAALLRFGDADHEASKVPVDRHERPPLALLRTRG
jgi:glucosyl-3-phosphoglycerate synthase